MLHFEEPLYLFVVAPCHRTVGGAMSPAIANKDVRVKEMDAPASVWPLHRCGTFFAFCLSYKIKRGTNGNLLLHGWGRAAAGADIWHHYRAAHRLWSCLLAWDLIFCLFRKKNLPWHNGKGQPTGSAVNPSDPTRLTGEFPASRHVCSQDRAVGQSEVSKEGWAEGKRGRLPVSK